MSRKDSVRSFLVTEICDALDLETHSALALFLEIITIKFLRGVLITVIIRY